MRATAALADLAPAILDRSNPGATKAARVEVTVRSKRGEKHGYYWGLPEKFFTLGKADGVRNGRTGGERSLLYQP